VLLEKGRATGVVTAKGERLSARVVVSNLNPRLLYTRLVDPAALPPDFLRRMQAWRCGSGTFRMNVALSELPSFNCLPGSEMAEHHGSGIIIAPSLAYMERAYSDARCYGWSREPIVELLIPSTLDRRWRRPASTSPACSASTWRPSCPTARAGTRTANRSPT
jgi:phytoene dehydrogenase-like protein